MSMHGRPLMLSLLLITAALAERVHAAPSIGEYRVIVHPSNSVSQVSRSFVADAFLKKVTRWNDGSAIKPIDLGRASAVRSQFAEQVLQREIQAVQRYWQQQIFSGRDLPPPEVDSDAAVVSYVLKHPGAIGYVSTSAQIQGARSLAIR